MDQPSLNESASPADAAPASNPEENTNPVLPFFPAALAREYGLDEADEEHPPFVVVTRTALEFCHWLRHATPAVQWLQVEDLLDEPEAWATAARKEGDVALDVIMSDPAAEFSHLYRLVDVRNVRDVRVTIPVAPGFLKALRLAASIQLPVRLLPGQPGPEQIEELLEAVDFYLHDPMVQAPIEWFHSTIASLNGVPVEDMWMILEQDPNEFPKLDDTGTPTLPAHQPGPVPENIVDAHTASLPDHNPDDPWEKLCRGYFQYPDPQYDGTGIKKVFEALKAGADEMNAALATREPTA
ncbi:MAG: hypothetical protein AAF591_07370 [Verrucomicrobiota bacterium]